MISDYLKKYSTYYLTRYSVTKKKFQDILKKKITKDFLEKKLNLDEKIDLENQVSDVVEFFEKLGALNEKTLIEVTFQNYVNKGYSKQKIKHKIIDLKFEEPMASEFLNKMFENQKFPELLVRNYLKKSKIIEKQKKLNISEKQLFDNILRKLANQGFEYYESIGILKKLISNGEP